MSSFLLAGATNSGQAQDWVLFFPSSFEFFTLDMSESQEALGIPGDIVKIAGPLTLGYLLSSILYGVLLLQIYLYYMAFPNDRLIIRALVYSCFILNTTQTILSLVDAFDIFGSGFGNVDSLMNMHRAGLSVPIMTGLISCSVQIFYGYQIYILSQSKILVGIIFAIAIIQCTGALIEGVYVLKINNLMTFQKLTFIECTIWLAGSALCDTIIAVSMTVYLLKTKKGFKQSHAIIVRLIRLIIETGTATATLAVIDCILFLTIQRYPFYTLPARLLGKVYANSLMVILNSRMKIVGGREDREGRGTDGRSYVYEDDGETGISWMSMTDARGRDRHRNRDRGSGGLSMGFLPTRSGTVSEPPSSVVFPIIASVTPSASVSRPSRSRGGRVSWASGDASRKIRVEAQTQTGRTATPVSIVASLGGLSSGHRNGSEASVNNGTSGGRNSMESVKTSDSSSFSSHDSKKLENSKLQHTTLTVEDSTLSESQVSHTSATEDLSTSNLV